MLSKQLSLESKLTSNEKKEIESTRSSLEKYINTVPVYVKNMLYIMKEIKVANADLESKKQAQIQFLLKLINGDDKQEVLQFNEFELLYLCYYMRKVQNEGIDEEHFFDVIRQERKEIHNHRKKTDWQKVFHAAKTALMEALKRSASKQIDPYDMNGKIKIDYRLYNNFKYLLGTHTGPWMTHFGKTDSEKLFEKTFVIHSKINEQESLHRAIQSKP